MIPLGKFIQRYKLEMVESQLSLAIVDLLIVFARVLAIAHIFSCCFFALGRHEYE